MGRKSFGCQCPACSAQAWCEAGLEDGADPEEIIDSFLYKAFEALEATFEENGLAVVIAPADKEKLH